MRDAADHIFYCEQTISSRRQIWLNKMINEKYLGLVIVGIVLNYVTNMNERKSSVHEERMYVFN